jgi:hypothetical protein
VLEDEFYRVWSRCGIRACVNYVNERKLSKILKTQFKLVKLADAFVQLQKT